MRKFIFVFVFVLIVTAVFPSLASAQTEVSYPSIPGVFSPEEIREVAGREADIFPLFMAYIFRLLLVVSIFVVIGVVLYAGFLYILSTGNTIRTKVAKEWVLSAIQGALIVFSSYVLLFALDSQLLLFRLSDLEETRGLEQIDLEWEIRNTYFQIPFGLLIEDAILNENAKNKFYDVLDATNEAEAEAEAIYQGSRQLLQLVEFCPIGMACGGNAPIAGPGPIPFSPATPHSRATSAHIPPTRGEAQEAAQQEVSLNFFDRFFKKDSFFELFTSSFFDYLKTKPFFSLTYFSQEVFATSDPSSGTIDLGSGTWTSVPAKDTPFGGGPGSADATSIDFTFSRDDGMLSNFHDYPGYDEETDTVTTTAYVAEDDDYYYITVPGNEDGDLIKVPKENDEDDEEEGDDTEEDDGEEDDGEEDDEEEDLDDLEPPEDFFCCPSCPIINPPIRAKIAEIEGYFPRLMSALEEMLDTKRPLEEDLYQLYKAAVIKTLGHRELFSYNSLVAERRYYEREDYVVKTDDTRTEIRGYFWDWSQWLYEHLYRRRVNGDIIEENDPVTFYIKEPDASRILEDATALGFAARATGIQDAGEKIGIPRRIPPAPPDIGTTLYSPVDPSTTRITSPYGIRHDPFTGEEVMHWGVDFAGPRNTPIYAAEDGEVVFAGWSGSETTGYGKLLALYHEANGENDLNQDIVTYYAHLEPHSFRYEVGDIVRRGDYIAGMGTTGRSTGYHLHYEVRTSVEYPFLLYTGNQVDPAAYIDLSQWAFQEEDSFYADLKNITEEEKSSTLVSLLEKLCIGDVLAQTDLDILNNYLLENNIDPRDLSEEELSQILEELNIDPEMLSVFDLRAVDVRSPSDYLSCGMEIPVGETFELTWHHIVEILNAIDYYVAEGERLIQQQRVMNSLASGCECPCVGDCCDCMCIDGDGNAYPCPVCGACQLTCNLGAIRAAHAQVAATRQTMREIAAYIELLTDGHFNTPTENLCDPLNEDIRDTEEELACRGGATILVTKHELITRKLNFSRYSLNECITRPEHLADVLDGTRSGHMPFFGPLAEEHRLQRYTKTRDDGFLINTSDLNWFCCSDERLQR
jgi:murein DD-endopeptidase MepM/ murein hydrolase activator NlpD